MTTTHSTTESSHSQDRPLMWVASEVAMQPLTEHKPKPHLSLNPFQSIRLWLEDLEVRDRKMARTLASVIPAQCPFERTIKLFDRTVLYIPPLCKLNPFYEELVGLRFKALCYLADECGEDISIYC